MKPAQPIEAAEPDFEAQGARLGLRLGRIMKEDDFDWNGLAQQRGRRVVHQLARRSPGRQGIPPAGRRLRGTRGRQETPGDEGVNECRTVRA